MHPLPIIPVFYTQNKTNIALDHGVLAVCNTSYAYLHRFSDKIESFLYSFNVGNEPCEQILFATSRYSRELICISSTKNLCTIFHGETKSIFPIHSYFTNIIVDDLFPSSFIAIIDNKTLQHLSYNSMNETKVQVKWIVELPEKSNHIILAKFDPRYALISTVSNKIILLFRSKAEKKFRIVKIFDELFHDKIIKIDCLLNDFFVIALDLSVYLFDVKTHFCFKIINTEKIITNIINIGDETNPKILLFHQDGSIDTYLFQNDKFEIIDKFKTINGKEIIPFHILDDEFFGLVNNFEIIKLKFENKRLVIKSHNYLFNMKERSKYSFSENTFAFVNGLSFIHIINILNFQTLCLYHEPDLKDFKLFSCNILLILLNGKIKKLTFNESNILEDSLFEEVDSFKVLQNQYILIHSKNEIYVVNIDGKVKSSRCFPNKINDYNIKMENDSFLIAISLENYGISFYDINMNSIYENINLQNVNFYNITFFDNYLYSIDSFQVLHRFIYNQGLMQHIFSKDSGIKFFSIYDKNHIYCSKKHFIFCLDSDFLLIDKLPIKSATLYIHNNEIFFTQPNSGLQKLFLNDNNIEIPLILHKLTSKKITIDRLYKRYCFYINLIRSSGCHPDFLYDISNLIGIPISFCQNSTNSLFHFLYLSFLNTNTNVDNIKNNLKQYEEALISKGNYLSSASLMNIINDKESTIKYLIESKEYYDLALIFACKNKTKNVENVLKNYSDNLFESGEIFNGFCLCKSFDLNEYLDKFIEQNHQYEYLNNINFV